jgi:hypothetical protein
MEGGLTTSRCACLHANHAGWGHTRDNKIRIVRGPDFARCADMASTSPSATSDLTRSGAVIVAIAASVVQMLMMIPGYSEDESFQFGEWLVVLAISLVLSLALFLFAVPRGGVIAGIVLGALALVSVLVFWAGITLPLAAAATATPPQARSWCSRSLWWPPWRSS